MNIITFDDRSFLFEFHKIGSRSRGYISVAENPQLLFSKEAPSIFSEPDYGRNNVFIGNNVAILKGFIAGNDSIIGNGSIVTKRIPANVIAAGTPARVIRDI